MRGGRWESSSKKGEPESLAGGEGFLRRTRGMLDRDGRRCLEGVGEVRGSSRELWNRAVLHSGMYSTSDKPPNLPDRKSVV